jgi:hypothetical protein
MRYSFNIFTYIYISSYPNSNQNFIKSMSRTMYSYTKSILERVSFDPKLFCKELEKAIKVLLPYEIDQLRDWLLQFTEQKPELRQCLIYIN